MRENPLNNWYVLRYIVDKDWFLYSEALIGRGLGDHSYDTHDS